MLNIVNRSIAKVIVGEPLCDNETWLRTSLDTTVYTGLICSDLLKYPAFLRPLVYFFAKSRKILDDNFTRAQGLLYQAFQERQRGGGNVDILQWLMDSNKADHLDVPFLTNQTLFVATAATRSTAASIVNTTFDLIAFSQYQEELREEIDQVLIGCGGWSLDAIQKMEKLDSFIKESQRLNHHILCEYHSYLPLFTLSHRCLNCVTPQPTNDRSIVQSQGET